MSDDPYRMYIVIRRGAFTTLDEGGRMVGLAAVRAVRQFEMPDEWLRRAGKVVLRARQPSQFARLLEEPHAAGGDGVIALPPRRRSERSETLLKIQAMSTELEAPPSSSTASVVYAVNPTVQMSTGKTLAQIAHAAVMADALGLDVSRARVIVPERWDGLDGCVAEVRDAGLTEVPPGTVTVRVLMSPPMRAFASDNYAPILPEALEAIAAANVGHAVSYGADEWTDQLRDRSEQVFGTRDIFPVFNGTGANVVGLRSMLRPWQGVVCAETAHLNVDEGGAPEVMGGIKLLTVVTPDGKLTPSLVDTRVVRIGDEHAVQPGVVSVTQSTELGTLYTVEELRALADHAHAHGMLFHIDGSRLANAAASLDVSLREVVEGADVVSFGGTKIGLLAAEAIVVLEPRARAVAVVPAQAVDAARLEDAVHLRAAARAARGRPVAQVRGARERDGRRGWPTACARSCRSRSRCRPTACSRSCPRAPRRSSSASSSSTSGTSSPARCAGCAPGTRPRRTSTRSSRP